MVGQPLPRCRKGMLALCLTPWEIPLGRSHWRSNKRAANSRPVRRKILSATEGGECYSVFMGCKPPLTEVETVVLDSGDADSCEDVGHGPSHMAQKLEQIKELTIAAAQKRSHLPQPLFWSLFHAQLAELKREKAAVRELEQLFAVK